MLLAHPDGNVESYRVEGDTPVFSQAHSTSEADLEKTLNNMRSNSGIGTSTGNPAGQA